MEGQTAGSENVPERVEFPAAAGRIQSVCAGDSHSAALTAAGQLFAWGVFRDSSGRCGARPPAARRVARACSLKHRPVDGDVSRVLVRVLGVLGCRWQAPTLYVGLPPPPAGHTIRRPYGSG